MQTRLPPKTVCPGRLSALGVTCLLPAPERQQAAVLARLADELTSEGHKQGLM